MTDTQQSRATLSAAYTTLDKIVTFFINNL